MIEVEHLSKAFGQLQAVRDVTFQVSRGEILGFLGPNGAGKTTTMRVLTGFFPATSGSVRVGGLDVFENSLAVRRMIGYLPESVPIYSEMIVQDYLSFVAEVKGLGRKERKQAVGRAIDNCGLETVRRRAIKKISKGFRQRVGLAQALLGDPALLILDEPTIGLDPAQIAEIRNLIKSLAGEKTIILSTHILPEASMLCQRVVIINNGRVVAEDTPENLGVAVSGGTRVRLACSGPFEKVQTALRAVNGVMKVDRAGDQGVFFVTVGPDSAVRPRMASAVLNAGWDLYELTPLTASLEDVFINLVTKEEEVQGNA